jgi:hypothetical protein
MTASSTEWRSKVDKLRRHLRHEAWEGLVEEMEIGFRDRQFMAMKAGRPGLEDMIGDLKVIRVPKVVEQSFRAVGKKLLKGVFYKETGQIFPAEGELVVHLYPNYDILFSESQSLQFIAQRIPGATLPVTAQSRDLSSQFKIRLSIAEDASIINVIAFFSDCVALGIWGFADPGLIEKHDLQWFVEEEGK